jgi:DNA-binding NarL/FixJ family response regulator
MFGERYAGGKSHCRAIAPPRRKARPEENLMNMNVEMDIGLDVNLNSIKVTPRDQQVLNLLVQGCSNKEIAGQLSISPRTVKQHLRTLFLRAGIRDGRKRVKLAIAAFGNQEVPR